MIQEIKTIKDVKTWFTHLFYEEHLNFHPDTPFEDYINGDTRQNTYSKEEAELRNRLVNKCFEICQLAGTDIYETANTVFEWFMNKKRNGK